MLSFFFNDKQAHLKHRERSVPFNRWRWPVHFGYIRWCKGKPSNTCVQVSCQNLQLELRLAVVWTNTTPSHPNALQPVVVYLWMFVFMPKIEWHDSTACFPHKWRSGLNWQHLFKNMLTCRYLVHVAVVTAIKYPNMITVGKKVRLSVNFSVFVKLSWEIRCKIEKQVWWSAPHSPSSMYWHSRMSRKPHHLPEEWGGG